MNNAAILYAESYAVSILLLTMVHSWFRRTGDHSASGNWYSLMLKAFIATFAFNLVWSLIYGGILPLDDPNHILMYVFKILYYLGLNVSFFAWTGYCEYEQGGGFYHDQEAFRILLLPYIFMGLCICTDYWTHLMFWFDKNGKYIRSNVFQVQMGMFALYLGVTGIRLVAKARYETNQSTRAHYMALGILSPLCVAVSWLLADVLGDEVPVISVLSALSILYIHVGSSSKQISIDKLTQINNRQNLMEHIDQRIRQHDSGLYLIMMDVDRFKQINDNFGHLEGDEALKHVANALKSACDVVKKRPYLARYGGDEFIIVMETDDSGEIEKLKANINEQLNYFNSWSSSGYTLMLSIGVCRWEEGMNRDALIERADENLYKVKSEHHKLLDQQNEAKQHPHA